MEGVEDHDKSGYHAVALCNINWESFIVDENSLGERVFAFG